MVKGGAIVCRMGAAIRRGEELAITRTLWEEGGIGPFVKVFLCPGTRTEIF